jgi:hypothetical protein
MAEVAVLEVLFEHLYTAINGVGKRDTNSGAPGRLVVCNPAVVAHFCPLRQRSHDPRDVTAPAVQRLLLTLSLILHDKAGARSRRRMRYRLISQRTNGLRDFRILIRRNGFPSTRASGNPGCSHWARRTARRARGADRPTPPLPSLNTAKRDLPIRSERHRFLT